MESGKRLRKQMAKVEYAACKDEINAMLAQDFNPKLIHEKLTEEGRFTMAYSSFTQILRNTPRTKSGTKASKAAKAASAAENKTPTPAAPQRPSGIIRAETKTFPDPSTMNPNDSY